MTAQLGPYTHRMPSPTCEQLRRSPTRLKVYVHPLPDELNVALIDCFAAATGSEPWQEVVQHRSLFAQYTAEIFMHRGLLSHPGIVTDPSEADLFYVPFYGALSARAGLCARTTHRQRVEQLARLLRSSVAFVQNPSRHVMAVGHFDLCCSNHSVLQMNDGLRRVIVASGMFMLIGDLWYPQSMHAVQCHRTWLAKWSAGLYLNEHFTRADDRDGCRARVIPYVANAQISAADATVIKSPAGGGRELLGVYVGTVHGLAFCGPTRIGTPWGRHCQLRRVLVDALGDAKDCVGAHSSDKSGREYASFMLRSIFCFVPRGDTPTTRRLFDAVSAGCIPVLIGDGLGYTLPFSALIPWTRIGIRVPEAYVLQRPRDLLRRLRAIPAQQVVDMRRALARVRDALLMTPSTAALALASTLCPLTAVPSHWGPPAFNSTAQIDS